MHRTSLSRLTIPVVVATAALSSACAHEVPLAPGRSLAATAAASADRRPDLGACENIAAPAGSKLVAHTYARGVQIYRWNGTSWVFGGPSAELYADAGGHGLVGTHYAGPKWESVDGSIVAGSVPVACPVGAGDIPWLLLTGTAEPIPGIFHRVTAIQRVNTVGGTMPTEDGSFVGEEKREPYTAEYYFYRTT